MIEEAIFHVYKGIKMCIATVTDKHLAEATLKKMVLLQHEF